MIYFLCICIISGSALIGKMISRIYVKRQIFYSEMDKFCNYLKANISFFHLKISEIFSAYLNTYQSENKDVFEDFKECITKNYNDKILFRNLVFLKKDEKDMIKRFVLNIGNNCEKNQLEMLDYYCKYFEEKHNDCVKVRKDYEGLIYKISLSIGATICILII